MLRSPFLDRVVRAWTLQMSSRPLLSSFVNSLFVLLAHLSVGCFSFFFTHRVLFIFQTLSTTHAVFVHFGNSNAVFADCFTKWMGPKSHSHMLDSHFIAHNRIVMFPLFSYEVQTMEYIKCCALLRAESQFLGGHSMEYSVNKCWIN